MAQTSLDALEADQEHVPTFVPFYAVLGWLDQPVPEAGVHLGNFTL